MQPVQLFKVPGSIVGVYTSNIMENFDRRIKLRILIQVYEVDFCFLFFF